MGAIDGATKERVVRPQRARTLLIATVLAAGAVAFFWVGTGSESRRGPVMFFLASAFFAVGAASVACNLLPGATDLHSTGSHLEMRKRFRTSSVPWTACGPFSVVRIGSARHVAFDLAEPQRPTGLIGGLNAAVVGRNAFIDFDYSAEELCAVLNGWRNEALRS